MATRTQQFKISLAAAMLALSTGACNDKSASTPPPPPVTSGTPKVPLAIDAGTAAPSTLPPTAQVPPNPGHGAQHPEETNKPPAPALPPTAPIPGTAVEAPADEAKRIFAQRCVVCHGQSGKGDGHAAASLSVKPRDYSDKKWQKTVTDKDLAAIIVNGGAKQGKSALMPGDETLKDKPAVVAELVAIIRSFAK